MSLHMQYIISNYIIKKSRQSEERCSTRKTVLLILKDFNPYIKLYWLTLYSDDSLVYRSNSFTCDDWVRTNLTKHRWLKSFFGDRFILFWEVILSFTRLSLSPKQHQIYK